MHDIDQARLSLGDEPPLVADGRSGPPDRREVSARWLSGTFLTGITSSVLMGVALFAALDGRELLAMPPAMLDVGSVDAGADEGEAAKTHRAIPPRTVARATDRRRMEVSTVTREGDRDVVRTLPYVQVHMALAAGHTTSRSYPPFDPLQVFAEDETTAARTADMGVIYGAKVESEVSLRTIDFPIETAAFDEQSVLSAAEVESVVRTTGAILGDGAVQVAALHYVDPQRFGDTLSSQVLGTSVGIRIVPENVSVAPLGAAPDDEVGYAEDILPFATERDLTEMLTEAGYGGPDMERMVESLTRLLGGPVIAAGHVLRMGIETQGEESRIMRASLYRGRDHLLTVAVDDRGQYVAGTEPEPNPAVISAFEETPPPVRSRGDLPTVYDGIYRAAYSYGMSPSMTRQLIKLLAAEVDYQARLNPSDQIEAFFSRPNADNVATADSELLYVSASFGGNTRTFYRFQMDDGTVDYFDAEGRSAKQFLLRSPVPNGQFRSGFGARRHPILGYTRMHTGVDWSAPSGTPIIASGNGTVEKAGWAGGYGRQTIIRHANGYKTSYNHQSAIARGISEGAEVRQGQVIGYVGATGLATGPHLHYELMVNGTKVDPMRVRLPVGRVLKDAELAAFENERTRIDRLLEEQDGPGLSLASARVGE